MFTLNNLSRSLTIVSEDILMKLASELNELDTMFTKFSDKSFMDKAKMIDEMVEQHKPGLSWFSEAQEASKKKHDLGWVDSKLNNSDDFEDEEEAEHAREEIKDFLARFPRRELYALASDLENMFHLLHATVKSVDSDIHNQNLSDIADKLSHLDDELKNTLHHLKSVSEKEFAYLDDFKNIMKSFKI